MKHISSLSDMKLNAQSKLLVIMPHPDDEVVFASGFINRCTQIGIKVRVITLTKGEKSSHRYGLQDGDDLGSIRENELDSANSILGVASNEVYNIPDCEVSRNIPQVKSLIKKEINTFKPTHIATYEPNGVYGHPDHIATSEIVSEMRVAEVLLYVTANQNFQPSQGAQALSLNKNIKPTQATHVINLTLKESFLKYKAIKAHRSQFPLDPLNFSYLVKLLRRGILTREYFIVR